MLQRISRSVLFDIGQTAIISSAVAWTLQWFFGLTGLFPFKALLFLSLGTVVVLLCARRYLPSATLGAANRVTLARGAMTCLLLAFIGEHASSGLAWFVVAVSSLTIILDGVDGWLARRSGWASSFGARFDMETDALFILGTAILCWQHGKAGPWILAAGLMRYVFAACSHLFPWINRPLPPSQRRRVVCVGQGLALVIALIPVFTSPVSDIVAMAGLALLSASFAADVTWLVRLRAVPLKSALYIESQRLAVGYRGKS